MSWLTGWTYQKSVPLSRASGAVTDYQMMLIIHRSTGTDSPGHVYVGSKCLANYNDIRFTNSDGTTLLDYHIDSSDANSATVWIEFDSIGTSDTTFYMYYGNAGASPVSSGANTFIVFDDFERGSDGDTVGGSWTEETAHCHISTDHAYGGTRCAKLVGATAGSDPKMSIPVTAGDIAYQFRVWHENALNGPIFIHGNASYRNYSYVSTDEHVFSFDGTHHDSGQTITADAWQQIEVRNFNYSANTYDIVLNDTTVISTLAMVVGSATENKVVIMMTSNGVGNDAYIDNFFVRKYYAAEPVWGTWGEETENKTIISPDPLAVTASLSGTPWPSLQKVTPGPMTVTASLDVSSVAGSYVVTPAALSAVASLSAGNILSFIDTNYLITYVCYLTPQPSTGLSTLTIPMSSFQGRFKSGDPSFLSIVTPGMSMASDITERVDDEDPPELSVYMVKTYADGNQISEQIMAVDLEDVRIDQGALNQSITLEGHRTITFPAKSVTLTGASYKNYESGSTRYRCKPDLYLRPGNTVTVNGETFTANYISLAISVESQTMEVSEEE